MGKQILPKAQSNEAASNVDDGIEQVAGIGFKEGRVKVRRLL